MELKIFFTSVIILLVMFMLFDLFDVNDTLRFIHLVITVSSSAVLVVSAIAHIWA